MRICTIALLLHASLADLDVASTADWRTVVIPVGDLDDPVVASEDDTVHSSADARCEAADGDGADTPAEACTLRAAIELANSLDRTVVTITIVAGRIVLAARLPEITGTLQLVGSVPIATHLLSDELHTDDSHAAHIGVDEGFRPGGAAGQRGPIGTIIDGGGQHQLLRTSTASSVHLQTVRLENGLATAAGSGRAAAGGAVNALGRLVLTNVALQKNSAVNGGAVYIEA